MAGTNAGEIRTASNGSIWVAPVGTTAPSTEVASYGSGWIDLGYATEDGVKFKDSKETRDQKVWQGFYPVGKKITGREAMLSFTLKQWNKANLSLAFGGTTNTTPSAGHYKVQPPAAETVDYRALGIDWVDGSLLYRLIVPRGLVGSDIETMLKRTEDSELPIEFGALPASSSNDPWYLLTNDGAFA